MRRFAGLELGRDAIPDEMSILNFRHLLERHALTKALLDRLTHHVHILEINSDSYRVKQSKSRRHKPSRREPEPGNETVDPETGGVTT